MLAYSSRGASLRFPGGLTHLHVDQVISLSVIVMNLIVHDGGKVKSADLLFLISEVLEADEGPVQLVVRERITFILLTSEPDTKNSNYIIGRQ